MARLTFWLYRALGCLIAALPLAAGIRLGRLLGVLGFFLGGKYRRIALENLAIAFPAYDAAQLREMAREHFARLGGNLFAMEKITRMPPERLRALVDVEGLEHLEPLISQKRGFAFIVSHLGNWELLAQLSPLVFPVPAGSVFQRLSNPWMDAHVRRMRARVGLALFERKDGFNAACELLRKGGAVGVLVDQHAGDGGVWCPLFGRLASTSPLAAMMALRTNAALLPLAMHTAGIGRWRMVIDAPLVPKGRDIGATTREINALLETQIRREPCDWFWVHRRWKTPQPQFLLRQYHRGISVAPGTPLQPFRILVRSSNWLGDAVMTIPAIRAIQRGRPDARLTVLTPAKLADVWRLVPEVADVIPIEPITGSGFRRWLALILQPWKVARRLRSLGFDAAVILPNSIRTAFEVWLARIPRRVGYPGHRGRAWMLNQIFIKKKRKRAKATAPAAPNHQVHHYLRLAEWIGADPADVANGSSSTFALPREPLPAGGPWKIAVCPGAEYGPAKRWPEAHFAEAMQQVAAQHACEWHLVGTAKDRPVAEMIVRSVGALRGVTNHCGETTLAQLIALLRGCHVLLSNDTGTMHLATLLGVPTVAIFGSTEPALTGPLGTGHTALRVPVDCSPCFLRECPIDFRCMTAITPGAAAAALLETLRREGR